MGRVLYFPSGMTAEQRLRRLEALAEEAYDEMYDARNASHVTACYSEVKDAMREAIGLARQLGQTDVEKRLEARLAHIKAVFRSQFT
jgi:hypothetical protein